MNQREQRQVEIILKKAKRRERIFLAVAIVAIIGSLFAVYWGKDTIKSAKENPYPLIDPGRRFIGQENLIVDFEPLRESLLKLEKDPNYQVGLYFEYLPTGSNIVVNRDLTLWPASLIKIPVAMAVMKKIERGQWKLGNELVLLDEDKDSDFGTLYQQPTGTRLTIEKLLYESLVTSDNTAHFILLRNLEEKELADMYDHVGMDDFLASAFKSSDDYENRMTARQYSRFFRSLYNATYLTPEYSQKFLEILTKNSETGLLRGGLPLEVKFAHKTGIRAATEGVYADSGVIFLTGRPYLLTIMAQAKQGVIEKEAADSLLGDISKQVYQYVSEYR